MQIAVLADPHVHAVHYPVPGLPPGTTHVELRTDQKVPKKTYQLKFEFSGNVTLL